MLTATHRIPGLVLRDHVFEVPLEPGRPSRPIEVFAREVVQPGKEHEDLPWLVFLQGGPGCASPRPLDASGWIGRALRSYRVLLLDQRGTGRSTPISAAALADLTPQEQADYLACFRADNIVSDCETVREILGAGPWSLLGQSFGGFCATHYLCAAPDGLREVFITGGLPPLTAHADDVYRRTYPRVAERNEQYYERYPGDVELVKSVARLLQEEDVRLPGGDRLSARRLQLLGLQLGFSDGAETLHYLFEQAWVPGREGRELSHVFLRGVENVMIFDTNPIFALLHEPCYAQGAATRWSAERILAEHPRFLPDAEGAFWFTGEMIYPFLFEEFAALAPLREAAHLLAARDDWLPLYDEALLDAAEVPVAAAVYKNDMYVDCGFSEETGAAIRGARLWVTNEYEHNGLRADGNRVLSRLIDMARGKA